MKKILLVALICLGAVSFARDDTFNAKRDIVKNVETGNYTCVPCSKTLSAEQVEKHVEFHEELEREERKSN